jgi:hypothetical protein
MQLFYLACRIIYFLEMSNADSHIESTTPPAGNSETAEGPVDESLREFLGEDAAIMARLNPFINDLT